jgi:nitroreductase
MDFFDVIRERRSIRKYREQAVETEKLLAVLEAARLAPSWKNQQCWRFLVLQEAGKRAALLDCFHEENPGRKGLGQAPVVIVVCADPQESGSEEGKDYYLADAAMAFEHLCLAARALGLGSCWMGWFDEVRLKGVLGIPKELRVLGVTPLGYPDQEPKPRPRKELAEIAFFEEWGESAC